MFSIEIKTTNAAFEDSPETEIARILREWADRIEEGAQGTYKVFDINGNSVGTLYFKEED
jgi:hypothetical protein